MRKTSPLRSPRSTRRSPPPQTATPSPSPGKTCWRVRLPTLAGKYRFVLAKPKLDYNALQPGGAATDALRAAAATLPDIAAHPGARARHRLRRPRGRGVRDPVVQGAAVGLIGSFLLVIVWLFLATQTWRLVVPILATLVLGLVLTTGFAAIAVGTLNLISVAFAILFVGIAVDFAIQFSVRLRERRRAHPMMHEAIRETGRRAGAQILVASLATASGFLAFTPTDFVGVAQLGTHRRRRHDHRLRLHPDFPACDDRPLPSA